MGIVTINDPALVFNLQATDGMSNLLANPRIRVKNHKKAKIHIGDRVPVITTTSTATGFASESVNYLDVGLKLDVEPSVMVADEVSIDIGLEVSTIVNEVTSKNGTLTYRIGTRNANTSLRLKNGETQMLAGLLSDDERSSSTGVPGLSQLPLIGRLFATKKDTHDKTEIVLLITPRIVRNIVPQDASFVEFSAGTDTGGSSVNVPFVTGEISPAIPMPVEVQQPEMMQPIPIDASPIDSSQKMGVPMIPTLPPPPPLPALPNPGTQSTP
jgi:general secretion pathway protein D